MMKDKAPKRESVRVVVVDDSATARDLLVGILRNTPGIQVIGTGNNGEEAVRLVQRLRPDVVTMDIRMPVMDGLEATRQIMREQPTPIVIISGSMQKQDMDLTFKALRAGALTALSKPGLDDPITCAQIAQTVRLMADVQVITHWNKPQKPEPRPVMELAKDKKLVQSVAPTATNFSEISVIGIASSTGGPSTLAAVLGGLPKDFPLPIVIVQHVSSGFAPGLADWLGTQTALRVEVAGHGDSLRPGLVLLAPDDYHMRVTELGAVELSKAAPFKGLRPSANFLFESLARVYGSHAMGVILTGMGDDGADGIQAMHYAGAVTIAQDEASCVVYGMPREAVLRNAIDRVLSPNNIALLFGAVGRERLAHLPDASFSERRG